MPELTHACIPIQSIHEINDTIVTGVVPITQIDWPFLTVTVKTLNKRQTSQMIHYPLVGVRYLRPEDLPKKNGIGPEMQ